MFAGRDYSPSDLGEAETYGLDFSSDLAAGETIVSAAWTCAVLTGVDPDPQSHVQGAGSINGTVAYQFFSGFLAGVTYRLLVTVTTNLGEIKILYSHVACQTPA
jgi:hypothetical protein